MARIGLNCLDPFRLVLVGLSCVIYFLLRIFVSKPVFIIVEKGGTPELRTNLFFL
jgi:hypothetical protein